MELLRTVAPASAVGFPRPSAGSRLPSLPTKRLHAISSQFRIAFVLPSSPASRATARASEKRQIAEDDVDMANLRELPSRSVCTSENTPLLVLLLSVVLALASAEAATALGPEGPLVEEFWDNMRRYGLYFLTVFTGGLYSLLQPILSLLRNPLSAVFTIAFLMGCFYLLYLTLNTMLGITAFNYEYAS